VYKKFIEFKEKKKEKGRKDPSRDFSLVDGNSIHYFWPGLIVLPKNNTLLPIAIKKI
jgi:hypothetical protein